MRNNRGWGLRSELWICLGMILFFAIAVILINRVFNNMNENGNFPIKDKNNVEEVKPKDDNKNTTIKENDKNNFDKEDKEDKEDIKESTNYSNLEDKVVLAGSKYASKYLVNEKFNDSKVVTVVRLQTEGILNNLEINGKKCSGYIKIESFETEFKYYPFINCGSYQTTGYDKSLDNID